MFRFFVLVSVVSLLACRLTLPALAQSDDPHIAAGNRKLAHTDANWDAGPSAGANLRIHTKPLKKDVNLVLVPVTITDGMYRIVPGLEKDNFLLMENNQPQEIRSFSTEDAPVSVGVLCDLSGSMADKIDKARQAIVEFFRTQILKMSSLS